MSKSERSVCSGRSWQLLAKRIVPWATLGTEFSGDVLEIGGGGGGMAEALGAANPQIRLTMTDIDPAMVDVARARLAHVPNVSTRHADVTRLPFPDRSYDIVLSFLMLHHVVEWEPAIDEVARVLRPGGIFVGYDLTHTALAEFVHRVDGSPHRLIPAATLEPALERAGLEPEHMRYSMRRHILRFVARKPA